MATEQFIQIVEENISCWQQLLVQRGIRGVVTEGENLLQAASMGLCVPQLWGLTAVYILQAYPIAESLGSGGQWAGVLETAVGTSPFTDSPLTIQLRNRLGRVHRLNQQPEKALNIHQQTLQQATPTTPAWAIAETHLNLAEDYHAQNDTARAEYHAQQAHQLFALSPEPPPKLEAAIHNLLGLLHLQKGDPTTAEPHLRHALTCWPAINDPVAVARLIKNLALSLASQGKFAAAHGYYQQALEQLRTVGNGVDQAKIENNIGILYLQTGQLEGAEAIFRQALTQTLPKNQHGKIRASITHNLGEACLAQNRLFEAGLFVQQAIVLWERLGDPIEVMNSIGVQGGILRRQGHLDEAIQTLERVLNSLNQKPNSGRVTELRREFSQELALCYAAKQALSIYPTPVLLNMSPDYVQTVDVDVEQAA